ncbi:MAG: methyltransferase [Granulosicoccaceae bacterium]
MQGCVNWLASQVATLQNTGMTSKNRLSTLGLGHLRQEQQFETQLHGNQLRFNTTWGLFSPRQIDEGSSLLLSLLELNSGEVVLDMGCGYGALGLAIAKAKPDAQVHMVDRDYLAIEYAQKNAALNDIGNTKIYTSDALSNVPADLPLTLMVSNLPAKVGNELFYISFCDAYDRLQPGGRIVVVTINGLRQFIKRSFNEVFGNYKKIKQSTSYTISSAFKDS